MHHANPRRPAVPTVPRDRLEAHRPLAPGERTVTAREIDAALVGRLSRTQRKQLMHALSGIAIVALMEASPILDTPA